jgi:hypothetical protein
VKCPHCKDGFGYLEPWPRKPDSADTDERKCICRDCGKRWIHVYPYRSTRRFQN